MDLTPIIVATIGAIAGISSVVFQVLRDRRKTEADALSVIEQTASRIADRNARLETRADLQDERINLLETQLTRMTATLAGAFVEIDGLRSGINLLIDQIRANEMTPVWTPDRVKPAPRTIDGVTHA